jgi:hypothetical protein
VKELSFWQEKLFLFIDNRLLTFQIPDYQQAFFWACGPDTGPYLDLNFKVILNLRFSPLNYPKSTLILLELESVIIHPHSSPGPRGVWIKKICMGTSLRP